MKRFTIADFKKGYCMVELHPDSRKLMTMALDIERFWWTWFPMGSIIAQDVFQRKLNSIFLDEPGVTGIADDMIIYRRDDQEHGMKHENLHNFLEVCRNNNLMLNAEKMQFRFSKSYLLWTYMEWQRTITRSKENQSCEKNGNASRHGNNEKFPRVDQLS